ncbi:AAA family ATPase [Sulfuricurvum sp.]|uniref:AAA family ATPase n=1 Tax=Sulfuricurvum sp. TaxID=2025608 RepID=UPI00356313E7
MNFNEKYRVNSLDDIKGQEYEIMKLKAIVKKVHDHIDDGDCPHLYFEGKPGTGKTTVAIAFLKDLFGKSWDMNFKEFNASETRIEQIRTEVIDLAQKQVLGEYKTKDGKIYDIPFNTIFFDEIDYLPPKSQAILRRIMEVNATNTRFILSCNYGHKVIDALKSRCVCCHFGSLRPDAIKEILNPIIKKESIKIEDDALELLANSSSGDARKAQNILFKAALSGKVTKEEIERATTSILEAFNTKILELAIVSNAANDATYDKNFKIIENHINRLYYERGYSATQILINIFDSVNNDEKIPIPVKRKLFGSIAECLRDCSIVDDDLYALKMWLRGLK